MWKRAGCPGSVDPAVCTEKVPPWPALAATAGHPEVGIVPAGHRVYRAHKVAAHLPAVQGQDVVFSMEQTRMR